MPEHDNFRDRIECPQCKCCEADLFECENCDEGFTDHDCGEDTCCCLEPDNNVVCDICHGNGTWIICLSGCTKAGRHLPGDRIAKRLGVL